MRNALYEGVRSLEGNVTVTRDGDRLDPAPSQAVWNHSPTGFEWGYGGSGPAQLALAILLDVLGDGDRAGDLHQSFKWAVVSNWDWAGFRITRAEVLDWVAANTHKASAIPFPAPD